MSCAGRAAVCLYRNMPFDFAPEENKAAIAKRVEATLGSQLEDLIAAAWLIYGITRSEPASEMHVMATGVINTFKLHEFGWQRSHLIPNRMMLEGEDATLDERIDQYVEAARKHQDNLRMNLGMMLAFVFMESRSSPDELMHQWVRGAMQRHEISEVAFTTMPDGVNFVPSESKNVQ